jgi:uncharacterized membrane protein
METIEQSIEVDAPVSTVYNQWTQFEEFPQFMEGVEEVRQLGNKRLHWVANVAGHRHEWDSEIYEQVPDQRIAWRSISGTPNNGEVSFEPVSGSRTRVRARIHYQPQGVLEKIGDALGVASARVKGDLKRFKEFMEARGTPTGGWRGEIHGGQTTRGTEATRSAETTPRSKRLYEEQDSDVSSSGTSDPNMGGSSQV